MEAQLVECINFSLNNYLFQNAVFLAERLHAQTPSEDNLHVLATCHYRSGRAYRVVSLLQGCVSAQNRYLFALCCYELGKLHDAQAALTGPSLLRHYTHSSSSYDDIPNGPAGLYLLGQIYRRLHQKDKAIACFKKSLVTYPFFWSAFESLCNMGEDVDPEEYFGGEKSKHVVLQQWKQQQLAQQAQHLHNMQHFQFLQQQQIPQQAQAHQPPQPAQQALAQQQAQAVQQIQQVNAQKAQQFLKPAQPLQPHPVLDASSNFADYSRFQTPMSLSTSIPFSPLSHSPIPLLQATPSPGWGLSKAFSFSQTPSSPLLSTPFSPPNSGYPSFVLEHPPTSPPPVNPATLTPAPPVDPITTNAPTPPQVSTPVSKPPPVLRRKEAAGRQRGQPSRPPSATTHTAPRRSARLLFGDETSTPAATPTAHAPVAATPAQNAAPAQHVFATPAPTQLAVSTNAGGRPQRPKPKAIKDNKRRTTEAISSATSFNTKLNAITNSSSHSNLSTKSSNTNTNTTNNLNMNNNTTNNANNNTNGTTTNILHNNNNIPQNNTGDSFLYTYNEDTHTGENPPPPSHASFSVSEPLHGALKLWQLLVLFGVAYRHLTACRCKEALEAILEFPPEHENTAWVKTLAGRAHFELVDYKSAADNFENARRLDPSRLDGMEIYSTVLWHLRRPEDLACLGQKLLELDRLDARTWCAVGNTFSLLKDHDQAIKVFKRSIQLDPTFSYAHTLTGHEYVANDDLDKAMASFRAAILVDPRHYNAWYGLGLIYFRQEKYEMAEKHFRMALKINPKSSVLYCYVGMVLLSSKKLYEALEMLNKAIDIDHKNTLARYKRAHVLASLDQHSEALQELDLLQNQAPREASIYILQAKIYKRLQEPFKALNALATAADLDPKNAPSLKDAMDKLSSSPSSSLDDDAENDGI
eukprot:Phypoly_transcript_02242.p1 GENE.Phypoly_transcript_02242~~Phypoly_transcript_02242.p1  ORF type:complete len:922 (-),score=189.41 Phypoly_transcript_02242:15-2780(-)